MSATFRHPFTLITKEVPAIEINEKNTLLIVQDFHLPFVDEESGFISKKARNLIVTIEFEEYQKLFNVALNNIKRIIPQAKDANVKVVYVCFGQYSPKDVSSLIRVMNWDFSLDKKPLFDDSIVADKKPTIYEKPGWSALSNPNFLKFIKPDVKNFIICGSILELGILNTSLDLMNLGYQVIIVSDAVSSFTFAGNTYCKGLIAHGLIKLRSTGEINDKLVNLKDKQKIMI